MKASKIFKVLVASGVNLDLLGRRQPQIYGNKSLEDVYRDLKSSRQDLESFYGIKVELSTFQTNDEVAFLEKLSEDWDGAVINPAAWTHTSLALADRLAGLELPFIEVHISNLSRREDIRRKSYTAPVAEGVVYGFGVDSYYIGLHAMMRYLANNGSDRLPS